MARFLLLCIWSIGGKAAWGKSMSLVRMIVPASTPLIPAAGMPSRVMLWLPTRHAMSFKIPTSSVSIRRYLMWVQKTFTLPSQGRGCHLLTDYFVRQIPEIQNIRVGLANFFLQHTSAALTLNENCCSDVRQDMAHILDRLVPDGRQYEHSDEGPDDMSAHAKCSIIGPSLTIPITNGQLNLGTWQGIWLLEFRNERVCLCLFRWVQEVASSILAVARIFGNICLPLLAMKRVKRPTSPTTENISSLLHQLPGDLLGKIIDLAPSSLSCYLLFRSLDHELRLRSCGCPRSLVFPTLRPYWCEFPRDEDVYDYSGEEMLLADDPDRLNFDCSPIPPAASFSAIVGPCKIVKELCLSHRGAVRQCGLKEASTGWIDTTFANHDVLRVLRIPSTLGLTEEALCRILSLLPSLEVLQLGAKGQPAESRSCLVTNRVLQCIATHCTRLVSLTLVFVPPGEMSDQESDLSLLVPACAHLRDLVLSYPEVLSGSLDRLLAAAGSLETLHVDTENGVEVTWGAIPHPERLRQVTLWDCDPGVLKALSTQHFDHLRVVHLRGDGPDIEVLRQNAATLEEVHLRCCKPRTVFAALQGCPRLARLDAGFDKACAGRHIARTLSHLRHARFDGVIRGPLDVDAPFLEELDLFDCKTEGDDDPKIRLCCPRLRMLRIPLDWAELIEWRGPHTSLTRVEADPKVGLYARPVLEKLPAWFGNLTILRGVAVPLRILHELCEGTSAPCLAVLQKTTVMPMEATDANDSLNPLAVTVRGHPGLLALDLHWRKTPLDQLELIAPGLKHLQLSAVACSLRLQCPALERVEAGELYALQTMQLLGPTPPLWRLWLDGCESDDMDPGSLCGLLSQVAEHLHDLRLGVSGHCLAGVMEVLDGLKRLELLNLISNFTVLRERSLVLRAPRLVELFIGRDPTAAIENPEAEEHDKKEVRLLLSCPCLERLDVEKAGLAQVEFLCDVPYFYSPVNSSPN
ncbi:putative RalA-binding protein 1 [Paratrimastix pyriformis]|uniref:RalA-binding protein 1 n=1 Tax=Paratrimastix pyriformis TaxID=342808 RepID=A0ABQ8UCG5_9EUKA|nr:putative RalA-binding protein 1 [Paratrimastix pyriformis]